MALIDLILNLAALLLWLKWRDQSPELSMPKISLIVTLKKAGPRSPRIWFLIGLVTLLLLRSVLYWQLGSALDWTPRIWFGVIPLPFRSDLLGRMLVFSFFSFGVALAFLYLSLLLLSILNSKKVGGDPIQNLAQQQLGKLEALPTVLKLLLPWFTMILLWFLLGKPLEALGILAAPQAVQYGLAQGAVTGLGIYLAWKYLIVGVLLLHVLSSYVYFGSGPFWIFIDHTARRILRFLSWIPLRLGKIDFAPLAAMALVIFAAEYGGRGLIWIYQRLPI